LYLQLQQQLIARIREFLAAQYGIELETLAVAQPPKIELGEFALPFAFELAKRLKKPPRKCAEEVVAAIGDIPGFAALEVAGAGYINAKVDRAAFARNAVSTEQLRAASLGKVLVEHTSINPNKAAHVGHLRNAVLGDTFVRLLRESGYQVDVQNYIDNTGVQVADVVVGFEKMEGKSLEEVRRLIAASERGELKPPFDYFCWELYARVSQWYEAGEENKSQRLAALHRIEAGGNATSQMADEVSTAVLRRHLETMQRLDIVYDFLPREREILHLKFWDAAFEQLRQKNVIYQPASGKKAGCWVMARDASLSRDDEENQEVIVRSNGTVTYVGKDIAYHLWKFGLLGRDFGYQRFYIYPGGHECWISVEHGEADHPHFGGVELSYNVIDSRQADAQHYVVEALRALGHPEAAKHHTHFSYEMVALTPSCAAELGYKIPEEDRARSYIEVSGRKGFGVKADDLLDALIAAAKREVDSRHPQRAGQQRLDIARQIAVGALRYFMLKFTKGTVIAFDFKDALSFEGETGPYCQYAVVRAGNIFRKGDTTPEAVLLESGGADWSKFVAEDDIWELWLTASKLPLIVEQCITTTEPAYLAKFAFQLAQQFNNFYHQHHILTEENPRRKQFLLATSAVVRRELVRTLALLGISVPEVM
jgi:arginyl-tRNA synthetase